MNIFSKLPKNRRLVKDTSGIFIGNIISMALGMLTSVILARSVSQADVGKYQLIISYLAIAGIASLPGMNVVLNKAAAKGFDGLFYPVIKRSIISSCGFAVLVMIAGTYLRYSGLNPEVGLNLIFVGFFLPLQGLEKYDSVFMGKRKFSLSRQMTIYSSIASFAVIGAIAYLTKSIHWVIVGLFFLRALNVCLGLRLARKCMEGVAVPDSVRADYLEQGWKQTYFSVFGIVVSQADKVILGSMSLNMLAIYYVGSILPGRIKDQLRALFGVVMNHWAVLPSKENYGKIKSNWWKIVGTGIILSAIICLGAPVFIPMFYGEAYRDSVVVAQLLSLSLPITLISSFILNANVFQKNGRYNNLQSLARQIAYLALLFVFVPPYGYFGIIIAILVSEFGAGAASILYFLREQKPD
jgi:O-antigen/teichoic acid export membrane protein